HELAKLPDFGDAGAPWLPPAPELAPFDAARQELLGQRWDELATHTGAVSSGVGAKLRGWSYMHAAGEFWASKFFATGNPEFFDLMVRAFKSASTAEDQARDAAAWESKARRDAAPPADAHAELVAALGSP
ncbi:MAG TPA: hypothetical protein VJT73_04860, partial [Polyangiaceae bacterium]|nr:hypothetical protein [Polyangiaceae bacterium]